jgi:hypothetical protein
LVEPLLALLVRQFLGVKKAPTRRVDARKQKKIAEVIIMLLTTIFKKIVGSDEEYSTVWKSKSVSFEALYAVVQ